MNYFDLLLCGSLLVSIPLNRINSIIILHSSATMQDNHNCTEKERERCKEDEGRKLIISSHIPGDRPFIRLGQQSTPHHTEDQYQDIVVWFIHTKYFLPPPLIEHCTSQLSPTILQHAFGLLQAVNNNRNHLHHRKATHSPDRSCSECERIQISSLLQITTLTLSHHQLLYVCVSSFGIRFCVSSLADCYQWR